MLKSILFVLPSAESGQPVTERVMAFVRFYEGEGYHCRLYPSPCSLRELIILIHFIYKGGWKAIFVTMPPFRNWSLCFLPRVKTMLDIRDGWSIAIKSGYGGTAKPNRWKACMAGFIENLAIRSSVLTITCTPGLLRHLSSVANRSSILLITNGFPSTDYDLVKRLRQESAGAKDNQNEVSFICAGKFSEYGIDNAKKLLNRIHSSFPGRKIKIRIYSTNKGVNSWAHSFLRDSGFHNVTIDLMDSVSRRVLLEDMVKFDFGIVLLRNEDYEFGTKVFDYIVCGLKIFGPHMSKSCFKISFRKFFLRKSSIDESMTFLRDEIIKTRREDLLKAMEEK